jgi:2-methylcitrate dehydratase PrpD
MNRPYTRQLVEYLSALDPSDLPDEVVDRAKYLLLDYLGVAIRGSHEESSQPVYRMVERSGAAGPCTVLGTAIRTSAVYAALANGTAGHAIELDDTHQGGSLHPGAVMWPVAIALSERRPEVDAGRLFTAVVAGYETAARLGMAVQPKIHYKLGWHPTATCGVFGAAITASKLLDLSVEQMLWAMGIAGSMAAGSLEFLATGAWTKRLHPGLAAKSGIEAALLAAEGFRGPETILEGHYGFLNGYSEEPIPELLTEGLGETFEILRTSVKPHACCRYKPETVVDAQFSMPFGAAVALLFQKAGPEQFTEENIRSPEVRNLMTTVVLSKDVRLEKNFPREWGTRVEVQLGDGGVLKKILRYPKGDPENPLSWEEVSGKFRELASASLAPQRCAEIEAVVRGLGRDGNVRRIWEMARC